MGPRTPVFSDLRGVSLQSRHPGPGVRGLASVVPICFWSVRRSQPESWVQPSSFRCCWGGRSTEGPKRQVTTQKLRVIRRQRLRLRLLRATSAASWKTAWTFSWSRAEHSR